MTRQRLKSKSLETPGPLESNCWIWQNYCDDGYGIINVGGRPHKAHRLAYILFKGEIPAGLQVHHICRNRSCINPEHLTLVTYDEHGRLSLKALQTHCKWGHEFTDENTYNKPSGGRQCRICQSSSIKRAYQLNLTSRKESSKEYYAKNREKKLAREKLRYREKLAAGWRPRQK